jgi:hypothetical protein
MLRRATALHWIGEAHIEPKQILRQRVARGGKSVSPSWARSWVLSEARTPEVPLVVAARLARDVQTAVDIAHLKHLIAQNELLPQDDTEIQATVASVSRLYDAVKQMSDAALARHAV